MPHIKLSKTIAAGLFAFGILAPSVMAAPKTFALEGEENATPHVYLTVPNGSGGFKSEDIYTASGCKTSTAGTAKYCAQGSELTLTNYQGYNIYLSDIADASIVLNGQNKITHTTSAVATSLIKIADGNLTISGEGTLTNTQLGITAFSAENITIDSGTYNFGTADGSGILFNIAPKTAGQGGTVTINGGSITQLAQAPTENGTNTNANAVTTMFGTTQFTGIVIDSVAQNTHLVMNGGSLNAKNSFVQFSGSESTFVMNNGAMDVNAVIALSGMTINGGKLNVVSELNLNALGSHGNIVFNGGVTNLKHQKGQYEIVVAKNSDIVLAEGMCLSNGATLVHQEGGDDGIKADDNGAATIQAGTCTAPQPSDDSGTDKGVGAPNTGFERAGAIIATVIAIPSLLAAIFGGRAVYRRLGKQIHFKK